MIVTARQLEELLKHTGKIVLPYRARLTPLAKDWIRQKKIEIGYSEAEDASSSAMPLATEPARRSLPAARKWLWWCDGPCGPAKAALATVSREAGYQTTEVAADPRRIAEAIRIIAKELKDGRADGAIVLVGNGALAMVYANRCPSIRAVLGTCIEAVEQGVRQVGANVLVIEHPYKSLQEAKTLLARFARTRPEVSEQVKKDLSELSSCE